MDELRCPVCGWAFDEEAKAYHVTYWGEGCGENTECANCGACLRVREHVVRTFEVEIHDFNRQGRCRRCRAQRET